MCYTITEKVLYANNLDPDLDLDADPDLDTSLVHVDTHCHSPKSVLSVSSLPLPAEWSFYWLCFSSLCSVDLVLR